jgi:hypothetical protein
VWLRARPELDRGLLQPSNQRASQPELVTVFPHSDRIVDLASVDFNRAADGASPSSPRSPDPWLPNEVNILESGTWRLEPFIVRGPAPEIAQPPPMPAPPASAATAGIETKSRSRSSWPRSGRISNGEWS